MGCANTKATRNQRTPASASAKAADYQTENDEIDDELPTLEVAESTVKPGIEKKEGGIDSGMFITKQKAHLSDRYSRERKLGSGAYGEVLLCRDKQTGAERAIKIIKKTSVNQGLGTNLLDEVAVVRTLDHPNIMKLYEFFEDRRNYYLVMEVYKGGELFDEIIHRQRLSEADAANIMKQVLSGVTYLHKYNIVHRDLKPENLLLESKAKDALIKIVDFGLSSSFDPTKKLKERLGTAYYIAPEVLRKKYDEKCDVWSCGVILYILLCGYPPFGGQTDQEILRRVEKGKFQFEPPEWTKVSEDAKDLIRNMLAYDPIKRHSAEQCLQHRWIVKMAEKKEGKVDNGHLNSALNNMKKFQSGQKLARAALLFMGSKLTTMEETKELTKIFRKLDINGDGQLDRSELVAGYRLLMKNRADTDDMNDSDIEEEVDRMMASVDFDKNGFIEYSEFVTVAMDSKTLLSKERLQAAFNLFDQDASGSIAAEELRQLIGDVDDAHWQVILAEVDTNGDGEVDFEEFVVMMQKLLRT
ncbi:MAG: hypothetical protein KVP17_001455 [Porospora cf. gigantea B]|uniref:uncharacterized protein n=1 Tax=Porospora cf. gigantea B TaxID=2853592 RepID=UPI003571D147|nr:MAG: hypothetical protein KVP17_001455 [Porospora cf. gigantea B]